MKKALLYLSICAIPVMAQTPSLQWAKNVNGALSGYDLVQNSWNDPAGNFLITGTSSSDAIAMKVDNSGNELLRLVYDGPKSSYDNGTAIRSDAAGNIYIGGLTDYAGINVPFVVKYNSSGVKLWE